MRTLAFGHCLSRFYYIAVCRGRFSNVLDLHVCVTFFGGECVDVFVCVNRVWFSAWFFGWLLGCYRISRKNTCTTPLPAHRRRGLCRYSAGDSVSQVDMRSKSYIVAH